MVFTHTAKKSLGQNFLTSTHLLKEIVTIGKVSPDESVLEIGPGKGALTKELLAAGALVTAVEKDDNLFTFLKEEYAHEISLGRLTLIHGDILELLEELTTGDKNYKLIANIPYNITGKIISGFLSAKNKPTLMLVMIQKEVAERIARNEKKESILSLSVKVYGTPRFAKKISRGMFSPPPNVDSALMLIENISRAFFEKHSIEEENFFLVVKAAFAHKRKKLISNIKESFPKTKWENVFENLALSENVRSEDLTADDFGRLTKNLIQ
jgi:16S rRNA (adenine1518-N6/adenine1519-N6)-dimethyltransferase